MNHLAEGAWALRYVLLFVAFLTAIALAADYRRRWHHAAGLVACYMEELRIADAYNEGLVERLAATTPGLPADDPIFAEGYAYDRTGAWDDTTREPRRVPR